MSSEEQVQVEINLHLEKIKDLRKKLGAEEEELQKLYNLLEVFKADDQKEIV